MPRKGSADSGRHGFHRKSEELSKILKAKGIKHTVLNAKYHEREAEIVAQAGKPGAVTIATNMAGRGTDIMLGGNAETMALDEIKKYLRHEVEDRVRRARWTSALRTTTSTT